jgi:D-alanine-D-alanine ligase
MKPEELRGKRIAVLMGGRCAEREVSLQSGGAVLEALRRRGYQAVGIDVGTDLGAVLAHERIEAAVIALHGRWGEDGCVQGLLEVAQIPYSDSGVLASAMAMDKVITKRLFELARIPTPAWRYPATRAAALELGLPVVVKPRREGSSVDLTVVREEAALEAAIAQAGGSGLGGRSALVEKYVEGREFSAGVLGEADEARSLGTVEIRAAAGIYDYEAKYLRDDTVYVVPAPVPEKVRARLEELGLAVHRLLECSGATRTDLIWDGDGSHDPVVLEINTIPGMTAHSLLPKLAASAGMSFDDLVERLALEASLKAGGAPAVR